MKKKALGKGLNALISDIPQEFIEENENTIQEIAIGRIVPNKTQPRKHFDSHLISELAISIKENGVIQPIVVSPIEEGRKYKIVVGERRYRASLEAGLKTIPCVVKELSENKILEWALIENLQREDLNPIEVAMAYQELLQRTEMTQEALADYLGKSRSALTNNLRLLKLPLLLQEDVMKGTLSEGHARSLLSLANIDEMIALRHKIVNENLSVRQTEQYIKSFKVSQNLNQEKKEKKHMDNIYTDNHTLHQLEEDFSHVLTAKVKVIPKTHTEGKIEIYYKNLKEFEELKKQLKSLKEDSTQFYI
jgi:ParB family chromosome partitioning protein